MRTLWILSLAALGAVATAPADQPSRERLEALLGESDVLNSPLRLLHALGTRELDLDRADLEAAVTDAHPSWVRALLGRATRVSAHGGQVALDHPDGLRLTGSQGSLGFARELRYAVEGRDLKDVRGLFQADPGQEFRALSAAPNAGPEAPAEPSGGLLGALAPVAGDSTPPLAPGDEGDAVRELQERLNAHRAAAGLEPIAVDGVFGPQTEAALRAFQQGAGGFATGVLDAETERALAEAPASADSTGPLRRGAEGPEVRALQQRLNDHRAAANLPSIGVDGDFGPQTEGAVQTFQQRAGLPASGVVDDATAQALAAQPAPPTQTALRRGAEGPEVEALQRRLNEHRAGAGLAPIGVDGDFGPATERAVQAFQQGASLPATGVVDDATARALLQPPPPVPTAPAPTGGTRVLTLPARPAGAIGGGAFMTRAIGQSTSTREAALVSEVQRGNVPGFLRTLRPVTFAGGGHRVTLYVSPDYVSVGSDQDFVRVPMTPGAAQRIADLTGCVLPTTRIVDAIYRQAQVKLTPLTQTPDATMTTPRIFLEHDRRVRAQFASAGGQLGLLTAGHKKDVVNTARLVTRPTQVAIYGWHRPSGNPIQPLSLVHGRGYADYSHGVRLVHQSADVDGSPRRIADVLRDPALAPLISSEGVLRSARLP
ncbi:MAG: peptidoglycan-binding protein [Planctomycetota bacterium]